MWRDWQNYITNPRLEESKLYNRGDKIRNRNLWITNIIKMIDSWTTIDSELQINDEILYYYMLLKK